MWIAGGVQYEGRASPPVSMRSYSDLTNASRGKPEIRSAAHRPHQLHAGADISNFRGERFGRSCYLQVGKANRAISGRRRKSHQHSGRDRFRRLVFGQCHWTLAQLQVAPPNDLLTSRILEAVNRPYVRWRRSSIHLASFVGFCYFPIIRVSMLMPLCSASRGRPRRVSAQLSSNLYRANRNAYKRPGLLPMVVRGTLGTTAWLSR